MHVMCRNSNIPTSGTLLQEEALIIVERLNIQGFSASKGCLEVFKTSHNVGTMKVSGEEDVRQATVDS